MKLATLLVACASAGAQSNFDVVVYGATAGGVTAAIAAAREGLNVALLEPGRHVGGMATGGLSRTDVGRREVIGGLALEFYYRVGIRYEVQRFNNPVAWFYEPKVGEGVMVEMLRQAGVTLLYNHRLKERDGVGMVGSAISQIITENGEVFRAKVFIDSSYEGDLLAQARVSYTSGREGIDQYGESLAGVRDRTPKHQFSVNVPARVDGKLLPEISIEPVGKPGHADRRVQAYNFRIIATNVAANRIPWPKPRNYDPWRYEVLARNVAGLTAEKGRPPVFHEMTLIAPIPGGKADFNNQGAFSTDYIGKNYEYPEGSYATRARIWRDHIDYVQGYYYFLANDPRVPKPLREEVSDWGLPKDEYLDTQNWPNQLYVREARRLVGEFVMTQKDLQTDLTKPDVIGMGSYNSDSHNVQRFINAQGFAENEGDMQVAVKPYQIPYRVMLPRRAEVTNLLVPVCFSASHVAYSSLRMEPQYMIMGHAAGVAAKLAIRDSKPVQAVDARELQAVLKKQGAVFTFTPTEQIEALTTMRNLLRPPAPARFNWE